LIIQLTGVAAIAAQNRGEVTYTYHRDKERYFAHQCRVTAEHVIPFIEQSGKLPEAARVLEIGCGEAGVLKAFLDRGAIAVGVDRNGTRLGRGKALLAKAIEEGRLTLLQRDAHSLTGEDEFIGSFDLIVLKDVIEHVDDRPNLFALMARLLRPEGRIFLAFPPWQMPFGGHQQICRSWFLSRLPYFHLLPTTAYRKILTAFSEQPARIESLLATKRTGISTSEFEGLVSATDYRIVDKRLYLFNPMYGYRFGLRPVLQARWVAAHAKARDFVSTCAYYIVQRRIGGVPAS
jgi:SAM-dependent methyltransferase